MKIAAGGTVSGTDGKLLSKVCPLLNHKATNRALMNDLLQMQKRTVKTVRSKTIITKAE
jgi:hypothetical protein